MSRVSNEALASAWRQRIAEQQRSQLSIAEFCSQAGVSAKSFYAWRRRLRDSASSSLRSSLFVPVELPAGSVTADVIRIELASGAVVTLPVAASADVITAVIRAATSVSSIEERPSC